MPQRTRATASITNDGVITYVEYDKGVGAIDDIKVDAYGDDYLQQYCSGYPTLFGYEPLYISLYGPGVEEPFTPAVEALFMKILLETLNECVDACIYIDDVLISSEELQKFSILGWELGRQLLDKFSILGWNPGRMLQRRRETKKRRIKKAVMRGRKRNKKRNKDRRALLPDDSESAAHGRSLVHEDDGPILPADNTCGELLMSKLYATGEPAFLCLFSSGAFITSCDPSLVPLLLGDEVVDYDSRTSAQKTSIQNSNTYPEEEEEIEYQKNKKRTRDRENENEDLIDYLNQRDKKTGRNNDRELEAGDMPPGGASSKVFQKMANKTRSAWSSLFS